MKDKIITLGHGSGGRQSDELVSFLLGPFRSEEQAPSLRTPRSFPGGTP